MPPYGGRFKLLEEAPKGQRATNSSAQRGVILKKGFKLKRAKNSFFKV